MSRPVTLGLLSALALAVGAPAVVSAAPAAHDVAAQVVTTPALASAAAAPAPAATSDASRYAVREQKDGKVADYQGGSVIVIGASGTALLVLLLVILLVL